MTCRQYLLLLHLSVLKSITCADQRDQALKIGGIFRSNGTMEEKAFRFAIDQVNKNRLLSNITLAPEVSYASNINAFENINSANQLISSGVIAIVGPSTSTAVRAMHSLCAKFNIPQVTQTATDPTFLFAYRHYPYLVRMSPSDTYQSYVLTSLISYYKWSRMGILTSHLDYGMNGLIDFKEQAQSMKWKILAVEHFAVPPDPSKINATKELLRLREKGTRVVLLNCLSQFVPHVLKQARQLDMMKDWVWILTDGAIDEVQSAHYVEGLIGVRITTDGRGDVYKSIKKDWMDIGGAIPVGSLSGRTYDAVLALAHGLKRMQEQNVTVTSPPQSTGVCQSTEAQPWSLGKKYLKNIKKVQTEGIMQSIGFNRRGSPDNRKFDIVNFQKDEGWVKVGTWDSYLDKELEIDRKRPVVWLSGTLNVPQLARLDLKYKKLKVLTALTRPFVMLKQNGSIVDQSNPFEGYCIDLFEELKKKLQFTYEIEIRKEFGDLQSDGSWSGIFGELMSGKADIAVSTFTISPDREKVIDFTQPYFSLGFKIVMRKEDSSKSNIWGFLDPFEATLWVAIICSSVVMGAVVWVFERLSPYGFYGRVVQSVEVDEDDLKEKNTLSFFNSFWSAVASYLQQGPDGLHPISHSGRAASLAWWFAISIFSATYTANLAAFLTVNKFEHPIKSIEDLAGQTKISYGTAPGQLKDMLSEASLPVYEKLWSYIETHGTLEPNASYAIEKVRRTKNHAFIWDSAVLDYEVQSEPCNTLTIVGRPFGTINYGLALPLGSPYTHNFSVAILELQQDGFLERMTEKWFQSRSVCGTETKVAETTASEGGDQLGFTGMAGVFITLFGGIIAGLVVLVIEWFVAAHKDTKSKDLQAPKGLCQALGRRMRKAWRGVLALCNSNDLEQDTKNDEQMIPLDTMPATREERMKIINY